MTVVTVDYHLVDGTVGYPTPHREVAAAFRWASANTADIAKVAAPVFVGGASAGANLAVGAALELRDQGQTLPAGLVLVYPLLHDPIPQAENPADLSSVPAVLRLPPHLISWMIANYRGNSDGRYVVIEGHDLRGLAPALVVASEYDDLRGSADAFADEARRAGVRVDEFLAEGVPHGHLNMPPSLVAVDGTLNAIQRFVRDMAP